MGVMERDDIRLLQPCAGEGSTTPSLPPTPHFPFSQGAGVTCSPFLLAAVIPSPAGEKLDAEEENEEVEKEDGLSPEKAAFLLVKKHLQELGKV